MKIKKFAKTGNPTEKVTIRVEIKAEREREFLEMVFHNTYLLQEIVNKNSDLKSIERFTHSEVKELADIFYIALVTDNH
jgi:hypothetical protein